MLLCDNPGCDRGYHMFCLEPPLEKAPLAFWYCPDCLPEQASAACCPRWLLCALAARRGWQLGG